MKKETMLPQKDLEKIYDAIFSMPGMNDKVRLSLQISRKNILLLTQVLEQGLSRGRENDVKGILALVPEATLSELSAIAEEFLAKSDLSAMHDKLKSF
jgi:hypothetical protein